MAGGSGGGGAQVRARQSPSVQELPPQGEWPSGSQQAVGQVPPEQQVCAAQFIPCAAPPPAAASFD